MYSVAWPANGGGGGRMINIIIIINVYNNIIIMADNVPYTRYFYDKPHSVATDCDVYLENTVIGIISYYSEVYTHTYAHIIIIIVTIITYSAPSVALAPPGRIVCTTYLTIVRKKKKW